MRRSILLLAAASLLTPSIASSQDVSNIFPDLWKRVVNEWDELLDERDNTLAVHLTLQDGTFIDELNLLLRDLKDSRDQISAVDSRWVDERRRGLIDAAEDAFKLASTLSKADAEATAERDLNRQFNDLEEAWDDLEVVIETFRRDLVAYHERLEEREDRFQREDYMTEARARGSRGYYQVVQWGETAGKVDDRGEIVQAIDYQLQALGEMNNQVRRIGDTVDDEDSEWLEDRRKAIIDVIDDVRADARTFSTAAADVTRDYSRYKSDWVRSFTKLREAFDDWTTEYTVYKEDLTDRLTAFERFCGRLCR